MGILLNLLTSQVIAIPSYRLPDPKTDYLPDLSPDQPTPAPIDPAKVVPVSAKAEQSWYNTGVSWLAASVVRVAKYWLYDPQKMDRLKNGPAIFKQEIDQITDLLEKYFGDELGTMLPAAQEAKEVIHDVFHVYVNMLFNNISEKAEHKIKQNVIDYFLSQLGTSENITTFIGPFLPKLCHPEDTFEQLLSVGFDFLNNKICEKLNGLAWEDMIASNRDLLESRLPGNHFSNVVKGLSISSVNCVRCLFEDETSGTYYSKIINDWITTNPKTKEAICEYMQWNDVGSETVNLIKNNPNHALWGVIENKFQSIYLELFVRLTEKLDTLTDEQRGKIIKSAVDTLTDYFHAKNKGQNYKLQSKEKIFAKFVKEALAILDIKESNFPVPPEWQKSAFDLCQDKVLPSVFESIVSSFLEEQFVMDQILSLLTQDKPKTETTSTPQKEPSEDFMKQVDPSMEKLVAELVRYFSPAGVPSLLSMLSLDEKIATQVSTILADMSFKDVLDQGVEHLSKNKVLEQQSKNIPKRTYEGFISEVEQTTDTLVDAFLKTKKSEMKRAFETTRKKPIDGVIAKLFHYIVVVPFAAVKYAASTVALTFAGWVSKHVIRYVIHRNKDAVYRDINKEAIYKWIRGVDLTPLMN